MAQIAQAEPRLALSVLHCQCLIMIKIFFFIVVSTNLSSHFSRKQGGKLRCVRFFRLINVPTEDVGNITTHFFNKRLTYRKFLYRLCKPCYVMCIFMCPFLIQFMKQCICHIASNECFFEYTVSFVFCCHIFCTSNVRVYPDTSLLVSQYTSLSYRLYISLNIIG